MSKLNGAFFYRIELSLFLKFFLLIILFPTSSTVASAYTFDSKDLSLRLYGKAYGYIYYERYDKYASQDNYPTDKLLVEVSPYTLIGLNGNYKNIMAKIEITLNPNEIIRQLYVKYNFSDVTSLLIGRTLSIDTYLFWQMTYEMNSLIGYGALSTHRKPMILFETHGAKIALSGLEGKSFADFSLVTDTKGIRQNRYLPHLEFAYKLSGGNYSLNFFGSVLYSSSTITFTSGDRKTYGSWSYYLGSGGKISFDKFYFEYVVYGGTNMTLDRAVAKSLAVPRYNPERNSIEDVYDFGGGINLGYNITQSLLLQLGLGSANYISNSYKYIDSNAGAYLNLFISFNDYFTLIPEVAYLDDISDGYGKREGGRLFTGVMVMVTF